MNTKIIKLDLNKSRLYEKIKAKQGDTESRFLLFQLFDGALPFSLKNRSVRAYMIKPDSKEVFNDLIINDRIKGYCTLELTNQVLAAPGTVKIELMITEGTKKLTSSVFELEVDKSINSEKSIVSTNEFTALLNGLASLSEYDNYKNELKDARDGETNVGTNIRKIKSQLDNKANEKSLDVERKRIDSFVSLPNGSTSGDAELIDIRIGADGKTYDNAGASVRGQIGKVIDYRNHLNPNILFDNSFFSLASNWAITLGTGSISNGLNMNVTAFPFRVKSQFINTSENIAYTLRLVYTCKNDLGATIAFYNSSNTYISQLDFTLSKNSKSIDKSFVTPTNTTKILILINAYAVESISVTGYFAQGSSLTELNLTEYIQNLATNVAINNSYKPLKDKKVLGIGDSIMEGAINFGGWLKILESDYGITPTNAGIGGTTMASSSVANPIWSRINNYISNDYDYILLEGGINDYFTNVPIGIVKPSTETGYNSGTYDTSTFAGALEQLIKTCVTTWTDKKIIYIIPHKYLDGSPENLSRQKQYWDIAKEICNKWGISYVDLFNNSLLNGLIPSIRDNYFKINGTEGDKLHPNEEGYRTQITNIVGKMLY